MSEVKKCYAGSVKEFREWFRKNHVKEGRVVLIIQKKHTGKPSMSHREQIEEAICWGWIDTTIKRIDDDTYSRVFVKRKPNAGWSNNTLSYAKEMIEKKRMTKFGLEAYERGLKKGVIDHGFPKNPEVPEDLAKAFGKEWAEKFREMAPSYRRTFLYWIMSAKRPETREKRIKETVRMVKEKKRLGVNEKDQK